MTITDARQAIPGRHSTGDSDAHQAFCGRGAAPGRRRANGDDGFVRSRSAVSEHPVPPTARAWISYIWNLTGRLRYYDIIVLL
jgi:hypothetical protein